MQRNLSKKAYKEACQYIAGGVNSPVRALKSVGADPLFIKKAKGVTLTDIDGYSYIDFCMSWGVFINGHSNKLVEKAVKKAVNNGTSYGIPTLQETTLAKMICRSVPSIERIRFVNSGTEAVMSAIRLARAYTNRQKIIKFDGCYHGHADHLLVAAGSGVAGLQSASSSGVPVAFIENTISIPYNDIEAIEGVFKLEGNQIAAVIIEPAAANMGMVVPQKEFLVKLRELTIQFNSILIFDEVITGFRLGVGGAQQTFDIKPDLTTLGKIIGGGFPVGAYGGSADIMALLAPDGPVYQAGTLSGNPVAMAAGIRTLEILNGPDFYDRLHRKSQAFYNNLESIINNRDVFLNKYGSMFTLFFSTEPVSNFQSALKCDLNRFSHFFQLMLEEGIYLSPSQFETNFISASHSEKDLNKVLRSIEKVLKLC